MSVCAVDTAGSTTVIVRSLSLSLSYRAECRRRRGRLSRRVSSGASLCATSVFHTPTPLSQLRLSALTTYEMPTMQWINSRESIFEAPRRHLRGALPTLLAVFFSGGIFVVPLLRLAIEKGRTSLTTSQKACHRCQQRGHLLRHCPRNASRHTSLPTSLYLQPPPSPLSRMRR